MRRTPLKEARALAVFPSTRGFGYAVLEGAQTLADWGATEVPRDKNAGSLLKVERLVAHYQPDVLILPDALAGQSRRAPRIQILCQQLANLAQTRKIRLVLFFTKEVRCRCLGGMPGTKYALALNLAGRFQSELGSCLPPKRRPWMSEDRRMDIFEAVALALTFQLKQAARRRLGGSPTTPPR